MWTLDGRPQGTLIQVRKVLFIYMLVLKTVAVFTVSMLLFDVLLAA